MEHYFSDKGTHHNYIAKRGLNANEEMALSIEFESANALVEYVNKNAVDNFNGWELQPDTVCDQSPNDKRIRHNDWRFGELSNYNATVRALFDGTATDSQLKMFTDKRAQLLTDYPALTELETMAAMFRKRKTFKDEGDDIDIDKYMEGNENMFRAKSQQQYMKRSAKINMAMPTAAANHPGNFSKSICFLAALSDIIETANVSTELSMSFCISGTSNKEDYTAITIVLKSATEPLDAQRLISMANVGVFRNFIFNAIWNIHGPGARVNGGLGYSINSSTYHSEFKNFIDADVHVYADDVCQSGEHNSHVDVLIKEIAKTIGMDFEFYRGVEFDVESTGMGTN